MKRLILASQSPARAALLKQVGYSFAVEPSNYDEDMSLAMAPADLAVHLATGKAQDIASQYTDAVIVAADTFVVYQGKNLGKPHTAANAKAMLRSLSGKTHQIITGICVMDTARNKTYKESHISTLRLRTITDREIDDYVATKEPLKKAGAYAIGLKAAVFVEHIEGDFYTVIGLPLSRVSMILGECGVVPKWIKK